MDDVFSILDYPWQIMHVPITPGETNQSTGAWTPPATVASVAITGSLQDISVKDMQRLPEGEYEIGDRRFSTLVALNDGDVLQVTEFDATVSNWYVKTRERTSYVMHSVGLPLRHTYLLKRKV